MKSELLKEFLYDNYDLDSFEVIYSPAGSSAILTDVDGLKLHVTDCGEYILVYDGECFDSYHLEKDRDGVERWVYGPNSLRDSE